jgi:hypothetical protein
MLLHGVLWDVTYRKVRGYGGIKSNSLAFLFYFGYYRLLKMVY